jgi:hypothetical protein
MDGAEPLLFHDVMVPSCFDNPVLVITMEHLIAPLHAPLLRPHQQPDREQRAPHTPDFPGACGERDPEDQRAKQGRLCNMSMSMCVTYRNNTRPNSQRPRVHRHSAVGMTRCLL